MMSHQTQYRNISSQDLYFGRKSNASTGVFQKQRPKPPIRQVRQNIAPYSTLQQPPSKNMIQVYQMNQSATQLNDEWTFQPFEVTIKRNSLGLGLSIMGGPDAEFPFSKLIRIKKIFPLQPAWEAGKLNPGDIILSAGGVPLSALTLRQAIDVLRSSHSGTITRLVVCRPPPDNHARQVFEELFQISNTDTMAEKKVADSELSNRPKTVHRSFSTCISTMANNNNMIKNGTPSNGPISISLLPNNQSTTVFCTASPTKPKRIATDKLKTKTNIVNYENDTKICRVKSSDDVEDSQAACVPYPMECEDINCSPGSNLTLDDSVQSFAQSNGRNGPVYVDNSPEREDGRDKETINIEADTLSGMYNTINVLQNDKISPSSIVGDEMMISNDHSHNGSQSLGTLDLLREIPAQTPNAQNFENVKAQQYGEFTITIRKVR